LAEKRRLLIACYTCNGDAPAEERGLAHDSAGIHDFGENRGRDLKLLKQLFVPGHGVDIEEHSAAGVAGIGDMFLALCEIPDKPGVYRSERDLSGFGFGSEALHVVEKPGDLRS